jgi:putative acetyltransferase
MASGTLIREERPGDESAIREVNDLAFGQPAEGSIVDALRASGCPLTSLVAIDGERIVGHILFSPVTIEAQGGTATGTGLAPMAVLPLLQSRGIGSTLVRAGLAEVRAKSYPFVVVLGHPRYYPRFGFVPASRHGIRCAWDEVPDEAFMAMVLDEAAMSGVAGIARYRPEFDAAI